ncbi:GNAT family N-acetyltransferase [bacterium]|nr:GNAT family N-acetyltransferase [bacterium]
MTSDSSGIEPLQFSVIEESDSEIEGFLSRRIREFNNVVSEPHRRVRVDKPQSLSIVVRNSAGEIVAGLSSSTYWEWLDIDNLWVSEHLRGQGIGRQLLRRAESLAQARGCRRVMLTTFSFQARGFYEKEGYQVVGALEDYPPGGVYYWMRKEMVG